MGCGSSKRPPVLTSLPNSTPHKRLSPTPSVEANNNHPEPPVPQEQKPETGASDLNDLELSFEKAASLRLDTPSQMWAAVRKTCSPNKKWTIEKNKSRRGWKTIRLFVSSTFKDFHVEREVLVKEVSLDWQYNVIPLSDYSFQIPLNCIEYETLLSTKDSSFVQSNLDLSYSICGVWRTF
jgi:hypothetical protein